MITCPKCGQDNMEGSVHCSECGAQLSPGEPLVTHRIKRNTADMDATTRPEPRERRPGSSRLDTWGTLHLLETGQMLPLTERNEFTLGRSSDGQPIMPDIDLSPYHAYASGVSRLHASIRRSGDRITLMDLGSSNGTYINGRRLPPNTEQALEHGDVIMFGKLKIQVLLKD